MPPRSILLQISAPHFGTEQAPVVEALATLARQQQPDVLVFSGDITQRARPVQFRAARAFADRLGAPVRAVPGNHDIPPPTRAGHPASVPGRLSPAPVLSTPTG